MWPIREWENRQLLIYSGHLLSPKAGWVVTVLLLLTLTPLAESCLPVSAVMLSKQNPWKWSSFKSRMKGIEMGLITHSVRGQIRNSFFIYTHTHTHTHTTPWSWHFIKSPLSCCFLICYLIREDKTGVIKDPFRQTHSLTSSEHCFSLEICFVLLDFENGQTYGQHV